MGGTYSFVSSASANLRTVNDPVNQFWGGFAAGAVAGLRSMLLQPKFSIFDLTRLQNEHSHRFSVTVWLLV